MRWWLSYHNFLNTSWWNPSLYQQRKRFFFGIYWKIFWSIENKIEILSGINIYFKLRVCKIPSKPTWLNISVLWPTSPLPTLLFPLVQATFLTNMPLKNTSIPNWSVLLLINLLLQTTLFLWPVSFCIRNFWLIFLVNVPSKEKKSAVSEVISVFQDEWDSAMLESFAVKQNLDIVRKELSHALYQYDAACRTIARLVKEKDEAKL